LQGTLLSLFPTCAAGLQGYSPKENLKNVTVYHPEKFISDISIKFSLRVQEK